MKRSIVILLFFSFLYVSLASFNANSAESFPLVPLKELSYSDYRFEQIRTELSELRHEQDKDYRSVGSQIINTSSFTSIAKREDMIRLDASIGIYDDYIEFQKNQSLPGGEELLFARQFYRYNSNRGFSFHRREYESYAVSMMSQLIKNEFPESSQEILRNTDIVPLSITDYICEPDFKSGFNCYYKFVVDAYVSPSNEIPANVPEKFRLDFEASDFYTQDHRVLTGQKTKVYKFEFSKISSIKEALKFSHRFRFDFEMESVELIADEKVVKELNLDNGVFQDCKEDGLILEKYEMASENHSSQMRRQLAEIVKKSGVDLNSSVRETYHNHPRKCEYHKSSNFFQCLAEDVLELKLSIPVP